MHGDSWKRIQTELEAAGPAGISVRELAERVGLPERTTRYQLHRLGSDLVDRYRHGWVRLGGQRRTPPVAITSDAGLRIWRLIRENRWSAYITGLDVLGGMTHHYVLSFPHVVVVEPEFGDELEDALSRNRFVVVRAGTALPRVSDVDRLVIVRRARSWVAPVYQVRDHIAPPELAWIDLYREARSGTFPISGQELGRLLSEFTADPDSRRRFETVVRRHFGGELGAALRGTFKNLFAETVAAGTNQ